MQTITTDACYAILIISEGDYNDFRSIIESASIYINDIFLDLKDDPSSHLLSKFKNLTKQFGIMLSQKRMVINVSEIDFLGMHIKDNQYFLETHVGQELLG